jgi:hypothetical protein
VRSTGLVDVDLQRRESADEHPRRTGVIEVDVGEVDRTGLAPVEAGEHRFDRAGRARIDQGAAALPCADHPVEAEVHGIDDARRRVAHAGKATRPARVRRADLQSGA